MKGYYPNSLSRIKTFPNTIKESNIVYEKMKNPDKEYFNMSDKSPRYPFYHYLDSKGLKYNDKEIEKIIKDSYPVIKVLKNYHNRPRPAQVNDKIKPIPSKTANTPSYPSGHALQAYLIAKHLSKKYPFRTYQFYSIADKIAKSRVSYGLHYPSDNTYAKELAKKM